MGDVRVYTVGNYIVFQKEEADDAERENNCRWVSYSPYSGGFPLEIEEVWKAPMLPVSSYLKFSFFLGCKGDVRLSVWLFPTLVLLFEILCCFKMQCHWAQKSPMVVPVLSCFLSAL